LVFALLALGLGGCAGIPADWGRGDVAQLAGTRGRTLPQADDAAAFTREAMSQPLTADTAVQLALLNNPALRGEMARLGFAAADVYDAGRLANPVFSARRLSPDNIDANAQLTLGIAVNFVNLLFLPANQKLAKAQFEAAKLEVGSAAVDLAADVEAGWYQAVGAEQLAQMRETVATAARSSADLAQRFFDAGNISRRELAMEQAAASQSHLDALSARAAAVASHSALNRLMGLSAAQDTWSLDARLAAPLPQEDELDALLALAVDSRLDVTALQQQAQALASRYGLVRRTRLVGGIELGVEREKDFDGALHAGPSLSLELPLFNWGAGRVAAAQAALDRTEAELDALVLDRSNGVKLAHAKIASAKTRAEAYRSALIPQREAVVEQMQREVNYMLTGVFELLLAKQQEYDAYAGYLEAVRDYWTARTELARAVGRRLPSSEQPAAPMLDPADLTRPKGGGMDHSDHSMDGMEDMEMKDMPGMEGMDHGTHGAHPKTEPPKEGEQPAVQEHTHVH